LWITRSPEVPQVLDPVLEEEEDLTTTEILTDMEEEVTETQTEVDMETRTEREAADLERLTLVSFADNLVTGKFLKNQKPIIKLI
jgi:hypothetical protein